MKNVHQYSQNHHQEVEESPASAVVHSNSAVVVEGAYEVEVVASAVDLEPIE